MAFCRRDRRGATREGRLGRNQAGFVGGLAAEESEHALWVAAGPQAREAVFSGDVMNLDRACFSLVRRIEGDVVEQGGGEGEEQEGQRQHQD